MKKVFVIGMMMVMSASAFAGNGEVGSVGNSNSGLALKCYDVKIDKASGNLLEQKDLESVRISKEKFLVPSEDGQITIEVKSNIDMSKEGQSYGYVSVKAPLGKFNLEQGQFVNKNGKEGSFVGNLPSSDHSIVRQAFCGFKEQQ